MTMTSTRLRPAPLALSALALSALVALAPSRAEACGGTFCDAGPQNMPVDQSGENILFWIDRSQAEPFTEAHIQIQYEGDAERFAWIIPVMEVPEVLVGSQALFDNMLAGTVPTFTINTRVEGDCGSGSVGLCSFSDDAGTALAGDDEAGDTGGFEGDTDGPEILDRGFAGAFEYVVITADDITTITTWLDDNGYQQDDEAPPILDEYLQDGFVFVAVKLRGDTGVDEIHPLAIRYPGVEPCIPIKLTRIAATDDMAIRAFFLGESRVAPQNWPQVALNWTKLAWLGDLIGSYRETVALAVDEAGGRAFVTEYAGTDQVVQTAGILGSGWSATAFTEIEAVDVVETLKAQGLVDCEGDFPNAPADCQFAHPQVRPLLERYLPVPEGLDPDEFWDCLECNVALIDPVAWGTQPGFAAEFDERITGPAQHALAMLEDASYLTRLYTLISPPEMLEDPLFHETDSLPPVDNTITATRVFSCEGNDWYEFPDGRVVALDGFGYPDFTDMPSAERIEQVPAMGPPQVETDNSEEIDDLLDEYNRDKLDGPAPWTCSTVGLRPEAVLTFLAIFGVAGLQRRRRRRR